MSDVQGPANTPILGGKVVRGNRKVYTSVSTSAREVIWSHGGQVNPSATETGPPWVAPFNLTLNSLILTLAAATNVSLMIGTNRNGVLLRADAMPTATLVNTIALAISLTAGQTLQPTLLGAATGTGVGLGICYRYTRAA